MTSALMRLLTAAAMALAAPVLFAAEAPLLRPGKQTLYERVLTTPGCALAAGAGASNGVVQPAFSRFYVYGRQALGDKTWLRVGPDSLGTVTGWLDAACTVAWNMQLTLAFTNPANRDRLLFFRERSTLEALLDKAEPAPDVAAIHSRLAVGQSATGVLAQEPEFFVDMKSQFYLLPVLGGEEVMTESGFRTRILNVASVSSADASSAPATNVSNQLKEFSAAIVFVIDSTISMDPYIDRTREAIAKVYRQVEADGLQDQVKFGLVAFRSSTQAVPGLEYVSHMYVNPGDVSSGKDFMAKVADLRQAKVSSKHFDEDAFAGVMHAIDQVDWRQFGARYIVLITDAGALDADNALSGTGLNAEQLRVEAANPGVAIYTLHLKTAAGKKNHAKAEAQYRALSTYGATGTSLYYPVDAGDVSAFGQRVDALANTVTSQVRAAYQGESAIGSALHAQSDPDPKQDPMLADARLIGHAMQLAYLGERTAATAPPVFEAWISDRDLVKLNIPSTEVRVLLTKSELSDLSDVVQEVLKAANDGLISPADMFSRLRSVAAAAGNDPTRLQQSTTTLAELGILGEYLEDLPYQSEVLALDEETWKSWDGLSQEKFIRTLHTKLRHYQRYNADTDRWVSLAQGSDPREHVYPVPLEVMP